MNRILAGAIIASAISVTALAAPAVTMPDPSRFLFWTPAEQAVGYRNIEKIFPTRVVKRGPTVSSLPHAPGPFEVAYVDDGRPMNVARFMETHRVSGLVIVQHGRILLERYGLGRTE